MATGGPIRARPTAEPTADDGLADSRLGRSGSDDAFKMAEVTPALPADKALGRICLVTSNFPRWRGDSTSPFVLHLAQDLTDLGWRVEVLAPHAPGAAIDETLGGIPVRRFRYMWPEGQQTVCYQGGALINLRKYPVNWLKLPPLVFCEWLALIRRLRSGRYDLVHSHWVLPQGLVGALAARPLRVPHVITIHGGDVFGLRGRALTWIKRYALTHATAVTVNSSATRDAVMQIAPGLGGVHRIPMGVTVRARPTNPDPCELRRRFRRHDGPLLVFVGRLVEEKGVDDLIRAIPPLRTRFPDISALIIGDGQERKRMQAMARDLGVADRVFFLGWVAADEVPNYLHAADIFVGPSKRSPDGWVEAQGLTFLEALLSRTPVVATRSGGIIDAVRHEETGLLVAENAPDEIAAAVERLVHDAELAARLGEAGYALAIGTFSRETSARAFSALFASRCRPGVRTGG